MKMSELIQKITSEGSKPLYSYEGICQACGIYEYIPYDLFNDRITIKYIVSWYCTDSIVGICAYYFDNSLVAISRQYGRKCNEEFSFISKEAKVKLTNFIRSLLKEEEDDYVIIDKNEEIMDTYNLEYLSQLILTVHTEGIYKGDLIKIESSMKENEIDINLTNNRTSYYAVFADGTSKKIYDFFEKLGEIKIQDIEFKLNL